MDGFPEKEPAGDVSDFSDDEALQPQFQPQPSRHGSVFSTIGSSDMPQIAGIDRNDYSDGDIKIIYEIVVRAETILDEELTPSSRLPTHALFLAYDEILAEYGLDPGERHISKLVFMVGGVKGQKSLMDKFKAVMARMNITLAIEEPLVSESEHEYRERYHAGSDTEDLRTIEDEHVPIAQARGAEPSGYKPGFKYGPEQSTESIDIATERYLADKAEAFRKRHHAQFLAAATLRRWHDTARYVNYLYAQSDATRETELREALEDKFRTWRTIAAEAEHATPRIIRPNAYSKRTERIAIRTHEILVTKKTFAEWRQSLQDERRKSRDAKLLADQLARRTYEDDDFKENPHLARIAQRAHRNIVLSQAFTSWSNRVEEEDAKAEVAAKAYAMSLKAKALGFARNRSAVDEMGKLSASKPSGAADSLGSRVTIPDSKKPEPSVPAVVQPTFTAPIPSRPFPLQKPLSSVDIATQLQTRRNPNIQPTPPAVLPTTVVLGATVPPAATAMDAVSAGAPTPAAPVEAAVVPQSNKDADMSDGDQPDERTMLARRHILRMRYFGALERYTAENIAKVEEFREERQNRRAIRSVSIWRDQAASRPQRAFKCNIEFEETRCYKRATGAVPKWRDKTSREVHREEKILEYYAERAQYYQKTTRALPVLRQKNEQAEQKKKLLGLYAERTNYYLRTTQALSTWQERAREVAQKHQLDKCYGERADFYYKTRNTVSKWKQKTRQRRKEKLKEAHLETRRLVKKGMGERCIRQWRNKLEPSYERYELMNVALGVALEDREWRRASQAFTIWRERAYERTEAAATGDAVLKQKAMEQWREKAASHSDLRAEAEEHRQIKAQSRALKSWNLGSLQSANRPEMAANALEKKERKLLRQRFETWYGRTADKLVPVELPDGTYRNVGQVVEGARQQGIENQARGLLTTWRMATADNRASQVQNEAYAPTPGRPQLLLGSFGRRETTTPLAPVPSYVRWQARDSAMGLCDTDDVCPPTRIRVANRASPDIPVSFDHRYTGPVAQQCHTWATRVDSMKGVLPGKPEASLQAISTGYWDGRRVIVYITGNGLSILSDPGTVLQTIYDNDSRNLEAVAFDEFSGKIAASTDGTIRIYRPLGHTHDSLKWALQATFDVETGPTPATLSWGSSEELLIGRSSLWLYDTASTPPTCHWRQKLAGPARSALLSYDSSYIASVGYHDRLVKIWRRLNFGSEEVHFEYGYLPHPRAVTSVQWRKPFHVDQTIENVLYSFCADNTLRVWTSVDGISSHTLRLWGKLDLLGAIPQDPSTCKQDIRWALIISQRDIANATEKVVQEQGNGQEKEDVALQYLLSIANRDTEVCVVFDGNGSMSAWALENVSSKPRGANTIDNVAFVKSKDFEFLSHSTTASHVEILSYCNKCSGHLHVLFHHFDGNIEVFESNIADLLDPTPRSGRLTHRATWSGHSGAIKKIVRNFSGHAIVTKTHPQDMSIKRTHVHKLLGECEYNIRGKPLCILVLPRQHAEDVSVAYVATITSEQRGIVWELHLPLDTGNASRAEKNGYQKPLREFCSFELEGAGDLAYVLPADPAGSKPVISGSLDVFAHDVAVSYTHSGRVEFWTARVDATRKRVEWLSTSSMETGVSEPALVSGSTMKKAALVNQNRSAVTIWDIRGARLEYEQDFESHNTVKDLDWTSTPDSQSILAVGFPYRVVLLSQMRFDYLNKGPAWAPIREISIREFTPHPIGDSTWLSDGNLIVGAGNQLFLYDRNFEETNTLMTSVRTTHHKPQEVDLFEVVQKLNGPLPVFHPQFLSQCILAGKHRLVKRILLALNHTLKYHVEGDTIDAYLGLDLAEFYVNEFSATINNTNDASHITRRMSFDDNDETFTEELAVSICERLQRIPLPQLSGHEQIQLVDIVECAGVVEKQRRSLDENGARFMVFFRQHALRKGRINEIHMSWREINWAYHSTSQDILMDFVSRNCHGTMTWEHARESGIFMWLTDATAVRTQFEIIARNEYTKNEVKNPVDCSLFYFALKKKAVLQGLWRMATWNKEQAATQRLLANNFEDHKWKTTALKNAYALLSKRRFEYAAAFFLLADHLQDAVNVCLNQIKDLQLAIAIARVYEGDTGIVLKRLLENDVLAVASQEGNRWLASWTFWMLKRRDMAVRALITPVFTLLDTPASPDLKAKLFLTDDPALIVLYSQLRQQSLQTLRGASKVTPRIEWDFVIHNASLYDRMGAQLGIPPPPYASAGFRRRR
ncbi:hypothetical protein NUW58_g4347 [Xylaria curta]|uniref:Uncharacterized protein n=1 Tax=Xylaria curta TaxID=42375 RepID=A0ACC1P859_9PEZI|nr:hypothetical protein NUW58_g4347 [Xylaria curta]